VALDETIKSRLGVARPLYRANSGRSSRRAAPVRASMLIDLVEPCPEQIARPHCPALLRPPSHAVTESCRAFRSKPRMKLQGSSVLATTCNSKSTSERETGYRSGYPFLAGNQSGGRVFSGLCDLIKPGPYLFLPNISSHFSPSSFLTSSAFSPSSFLIASTFFDASSSILRKAARPAA